MSGSAGWKVAVECGAFSERPEQECCGFGGPEGWGRTGHTWHSSGAIPVWFKVVWEQTGEEESGAKKITSCLSCGCRAEVRELDLHLITHYVNCKQCKLDT